jgi:hypothetical protein
MSKSLIRAPQWVGGISLVVLTLFVALAFVAARGFRVEHPALPVSTA